MPKYKYKYSQLDEFINAWFNAHFFHLLRKLEERPIGKRIKINRCVNLGCNQERL